MGFFFAAGDPVMSFRLGPLQCCHRAIDSDEERKNLKTLKLTLIGSHRDFPMYNYVVIYLILPGHADIVGSSWLMTDIKCLMRCTSVLLKLALRRNS